jgi:hypothetical protein
MPNTNAITLPGSIHTSKQKRKNLTADNARHRIAYKKETAIKRSGPMGIKGENVLGSAQRVAVRERGKAKEKMSLPRRVYACQCNDLKGKDR